MSGKLALPTPGQAARRIPIGRANARRALAVCQSYLLDQPRSFVLFDCLILVNLAYMSNLDFDVARLGLAQIGMAWLGWT